MSVRRTDTAEAREFWEFVDRTSKEVGRNRPVWAQAQAEARGDYRHTWRAICWLDGKAKE